MNPHDKSRSNTTIIQSDIDIKSWIEHTPTVDEVRPRRCPKCGAPSCPVGAPIVIHGHGLRDRQIRGPSAPNAPPAMIGISVRRYICTACKAVPVVVPREVRAKRLYTASAIGFGLALWGLMQLKATEVRQWLNPAKVVGFSDDWATVRRWAKDVATGKLFVDLPRPPIGAKLRNVAATAASALAGCADPLTRSLSLEHRAFVGAAHVA